MLLPIFLKKLKKSLRDREHYKHKPTKKPFQIEALQTSVQPLGAQTLQTNLELRLLRLVRLLM
jgi:hypothetical protein